jgi:hypothetical protein
MTLYYSADTDSRGFKGFRIDSDTVSLLAWLPEGASAISAEETARLFVASVNAINALAKAQGVHPVLLAEALAKRNALTGDTPLIKAYGASESTLIPRHVTLPKWLEGTLKSALSPFNKLKGKRP